MGPTEKPILVAAFESPGDNLPDQSLLPEYHQILGLGSDGPDTVRYAALKNCALENGKRRVYSPGPSLSSLALNIVNLLKIGPVRMRNNGRETDLPYPSGGGRTP